MKQMMILARRINGIFKKVKKQFGYYEYNYYKGYLKDYSNPPVLPDSLKGFYFYEGSDENIELFKYDLPKSLQRSWATLIEEGALRGDKSLIFLSPKGKMAYYIWYSIGKSIYTHEINKTLQFNRNEAYIYAQRVVPEFKGIGLAKYTMRHLFFRLQKSGVKWVHGICIKDKPIPNHLCKDLGMELIIKYKKYRMRKWQWIRKVSLV